jgi:hypothetical protein
LVWYNKASFYALVVSLKSGCKSKRRKSKTIFKKKVNGNKPAKEWQTKDVRT